jgi:hypothetical protein
LIYFNQDKSDVKIVYQTLYNLGNTQFSPKRKKQKSENGGKYGNKLMSTILDKTGIIHDLSPPYAHESSGLLWSMNQTIVTMVRSMIYDFNDVIASRTFT